MLRKIRRALMGLASLTAFGGALALITSPNVSPAMGFASLWLIVVGVALFGEFTG